VLRADVSQTASVYVGRLGTCSQDIAGEIQCWGNNRAVNQLPTDELANAQAIDFGDSHGCALMVDGAVRCFGDSAFGRTGDRDDGLIDLPDVVELEVGSHHTCALNDSGRVLCWGHGFAGALGIPEDELSRCRDGDSGGACSVTPLAPSSLPRSRAVSVGACRTCTIDMTGGVLCWGGWTVDLSTGWCVPGGEECDAVATMVEGIDDAVAIETGGSVACIIDGEGAVHCWGWVAQGQLGDGRGTEGYTRVPVRVLGFGE
jgi:alpha-tubulin suppressor-like RCC1 family protein